MTNPAVRPSNPSSVLFTTALAICVLGLAACGDDGSADASAGLQWYKTCGDPACGGYTPDPNATLCQSQMVGDACTPADERCEIADDECNADLLCTDSDPATNCPISLAGAKREIRYLDRGERDRLARELLATRLATFRYRDRPDEEAPRLGFIIDDQPTSPAVRGDGTRVDLYGYVSMTVAALQAQDETIAVLRAEVASLRAELDRTIRERERSEAKRPDRPENSIGSTRRRDP